MFRRKRNIPELPLRAIIGLEANNGRDNHSAIPIRLVGPIQVDHSITHEPIPKPQHAIIIFMMEDGRSFNQYVDIGKFWKSPIFHIPEGATDFFIEWNWNK